MEERRTSAAPGGDGAGADDVVAATAAAERTPIGDDDEVEEGDFVIGNRTSDAGIGDVVVVVVGDSEEGSLQERQR